MNKKVKIIMVLLTLLTLISLTGCNSYEKNSYEKCTTDKCFEEALNDCSMTEKKECWMGWCQTTRITGEENGRCTIYHFSESDGNINEVKECSIKKGAVQEEDCLFRYGCRGDYISPAYICK